MACDLSICFCIQCHDEHPHIFALGQLAFSHSSSSLKQNTKQPFRKFIVLNILTILDLFCFIFFAVQLFNYQGHCFLLEAEFTFVLLFVILVIQPCLTLCDPIECHPPASSIHGIFQARILEWVAISSSRGTFQSRDQTYVSCVSCITGRFFSAEPPGKPYIYSIPQDLLLQITLALILLRRNTVVFCKATYSACKLSSFLKLNTLN